MESKTKKMIIIGSVTFLVVVVVALSIALPITLKNREDKTNSTNNNSTVTTPLVRLTNITTTTTDMIQLQTTTTDQSQLNDILKSPPNPIGPFMPPIDTFELSNVPSMRSPSSYNLAVGIKMTDAKLKSPKK